MTDKTQDKDIHTKLREISLSFVMVFNPTDEDFVIKWAQAGIHYYGKGGGSGQTGDPPQNWIVPHKNNDTGYGKGKKEVPFFIAEKYYKEMSTKLINEEADKKMRAKKNSWKRDPDEFATWWRNNHDKLVDYETLKDNHRKELILGVTRKYSDEIVEDGVTTPRLKSESEEVIDNFDSIGQYTPEEKEVIKKNKKDLVKQVAA